ncbi:MAG: amino acid ABC transporter permease [Nitriliruptoraceae bacterium]|nr:amino acid ABC transporter permease [Nitriliruptoraceae bacterium]
MSAERAAPVDRARRAGPRPPVKATLTPRERYLPASISIVSTVVVFGVLWRVVTSAENWPLIERQFFNVEAMRASFPEVLRGFALNMRIWVVALVLIAIFGVIIAIFRSLTGPWAAPLRVFAIVYIDLLRGMPSILLVLLFGLGIPALNLPGVTSSNTFWGSVALVLGYSAYTSEVYRSGIEAVPDGQRAAAKALGLTQWQTLRYSILPQAVRNVIPALLNLAVALQKDVALLSVIGVREAVRNAQIFTARTFNFSSYMVATVLFLLATIPMARFTDWVTKRDQERRLQRTL